MAEATPVKQRRASRKDEQLGGALVVEDPDLLERRHRERMEARKARQEERLKMQQSIRQATMDDDGLDAPEGILASAQALHRVD